jgi:hypothetical protein
MYFTQFLLPDGRQKRVEIDRPDEIEAKAKAVVAAGGRFETEVLTTGVVSFTVEHDEWEADDRGTVAHELCANDPTVLEAVDKLVETAHAALCDG